MVARKSADCPDLRDTSSSTRTGSDLLDARPRRPRAKLAERESLLQFDDAINIQYTSGTTGFPKGATLSHHNILNNGYLVGEMISTRAGPRLHPVPFYHCFGMVMGNLACSSHGACMVVPARRSIRWRRSKPSRPSAARRSTACRRCSSRSFASAVQRVRLSIAAHRHHGGLAVSR
jgi:acyl-CoA synthetase (AMP-forming)/AMP-acid ligase II